MGALVSPSVGNFKGVQVHKAAWADIMVQRQKTNKAIPKLQAFPLGESRAARNGGAEGLC